MKKFLLLCFSFVFVLSAWAQERVVSGKITAAEDGSTLPGVNVVLKGTTNGTVTDVDGNYRLNVPSSGGTLVYSFIGLQTQEVAIGERSIIDLQMGLDVQQLTEVVVTAVGIEREKKALGYSVASVDAANLQQRSEVDPLRALQGKMPGVNITGGGGGPGQSTKINIRGISSLTGNTQPLFVVDGIPFDNSVNSSTLEGQGSGQENNAQNTVISNRAFDLDPNNIASVSILKGAAAAALYGSRATNGVVIITTKAASKGTKKGMEITVSSSYNVEEISGIPDYQDVYTQGSNQVYNGGFIGNWGAPFADKVDAINAEYGTNYGKSFGVYAGGPNAGQPYPEGTGPHPMAVRFPALTQFRDGDGQPLAVPIVPHDIIGGFFDKGHTSENSFTISNGSEKVNLNASVSRMDQTGMIPNSGATRTSISFGGNGQLDNGVFISGNVNYVNTTQYSPPSGASAFNDYFSGPNGDFAAGGSIYARLFYLPRNFNLNGYPFENPVDGSNLFYRALDNPRWIAKYNKYSSDVNRAYGSFSAGYDVTEWLQVLVKGGINTYTDNRKDIVRSGGIQEPLGHVWNDVLTNTEQDYNFIVTIQKDINADIAFRGIVGANANQRDFSRNRVEGTGIISDGLNTGLYRLDGTSSQISTSDYTSQRRLNGVYGDLSFSYRDFLFLNLAGRNDWSSTLPQDNNNYFYPSASLSFVLSEAVTMPSFLNYAKFRIAASKVGNDANVYQTATNYSIGVPFTTSGGTVTNRATLSNTLGNPDLKPEFTTEYEVGTELKFLNNRVSLDAAYFQRTSTDQILSAALPRSTGFRQQIVNFGELENKGWEIGLNVTPVQLSNGFTWDSYVAFTRIRSLVVDAGPTGEVIIGGPGTGLATIHRNGFPYGQIFGTVNARSDDGQLLIDENTGLPFGTGQSEIIGDPNPDFTLGWSHTFSWKGISLRALIDWKQGGEFYSFTGASLLLRGQLQQSIDREGLRVVPGVLGSNQTFQAITDSGGNLIPNTVGITAFDAHFSDGWGAYGQDEVNVYDGTTIRLREISLGYSLPASMLSKTPFGRVSISVSGRNLWWKAPNVLDDLNIDPEVLSGTSASNVQGFELGAAPTTKRYGVNVNLTF
ncbi:MAG: SusC/RagA family TonB-linked outer membrane protein [Cyclobacteriaceae bacterium]